MQKLVILALFGCLACFFAPQSAHATLIQAAWFFNGNDNADVSNLSQTVSAANGNITFDLQVSITSSTGNPVVDTFGDGISSTPFFGLSAVGEELTFALSPVPSVVQNGSHRVFLSDLTFLFLGTEAANAPTDGGTVITVPGSSSWTQAGLLPQDFPGHLPFVTQYGGPNAAGFFIERGTNGGAQQTGSFNVQAGFDIPRTNVNNGGVPGTLVTNFRHRTDSGTYRLNDIVVQVRATPEPSSLLLGLVAALIGMLKLGWRRTLQLVGFRKASKLATSEELHCVG